MTPRGRGWVWWIVVGSVVLAAIVVAGVAYAVAPSAPSSSDELASLLVTPRDRTMTTGAITYGVSGSAPDPRRAQGARWTVASAWTTPNHLSGALYLTQYHTKDQARAALATVAQTPITRHDVPGHPGAFILEAPGALALSVHPMVGVGAKGTVLVYVLAIGETVEYLTQLLGDQLDRLP